MISIKFTTLFLLLSFSIPTFGMSLRYKDQSLSSKKKELIYSSSNIKFKTRVQECALKLAPVFFEKFKQKKDKPNRLESLKIKRSPVRYSFNGKKLETYEGSKIHYRLEKLKADVLLLKFRVEKKC